MIVSSVSPRVADGRRIVALLVVERRVEQQAAHADDGVHRRADLVAHRGQEGALGFVGGFGGSAGLLRLPEKLGVLDGDHRLVGKGLDQAMSRSLNGAGGKRLTASAPMPRPCHTIGAYSTEKLPNSCAVPAQSLGHIGAVQDIRVVQHPVLVDDVAVDRIAQGPRELTLQAPEHRQLIRRHLRQAVSIHDQSHHAVVAHQPDVGEHALEQDVAAGQDLVEDGRSVGHGGADHA